MTMDIQTNVARVIPLLEEPAIHYQAALYFLDGHYLFRYRQDEGWAAKFVTAADVSAAFSGAEQDTGWLQAGVVRAGVHARGTFFVYSAPPQKVTILFDGETEPVNVPIPRTVFLGVGQTYYLWALEGKYFDPDALAHAAPFPNVHADGKVCWGNNTPPAADPARARAAWELFFSTPFNNHLVDKKSRDYPDDVRLQLRRLAGARQYPVSDLLDTGATVERTIKSILGG